MSAILALLIQIAGATSEASTIGSIVSTLVQLVPTLVKEYNDLVGPVKNIIAALSLNPVTTADQLATLQDLDIKVDADFEAAVAQANAEDGAP